jgi:hypothetical protein
MQPYGGEGNIRFADIAADPVIESFGVQARSREVDPDFVECRQQSSNMSGRFQNISNSDAYLRRSSTSILEARLSVHSTSSRTLLTRDVIDALSFILKIMVNKTVYFSVNQNKGAPFPGLRAMSACFVPTFS